MHQINYDTYKENVDKNKVQKELDNRARYASSEGASGLGAIIQDRKNKAYVSCKGCGSKLATAFLSVNMCPLCKGILLTDTQVKKIASYDSKIKKCAETMAEEEKKLKEKQRKKAIVKWLVKTEYHV